MPSVYNILYNHAACTILAANIQTITKSNMARKQPPGFSNKIMQIEYSPLPPVSPQTHHR
jgi:hypothetical protein